AADHSCISASLACVSSAVAEPASPGASAKLGIRPDSIACMFSVKARAAFSCASSTALPCADQKSVSAFAYSLMTPPRSLRELDHLAHRLALMQAVEPLVDLVQRQLAAHQPVHRQLARPVQRDVARDVARGHAGA